MMKLGRVGVCAASDTAIATRKPPRNSTGEI